MICKYSILKATLPNGYMLLISKYYVTIINTIFNNRRKMEQNQSNNPENMQTEKTSLLATGRKFGAKGIRYFMLTLLTFGTLNIVFLIASVIKLKTIENTSSYILAIILVLFIGIGLTILACYLTYKYLIMDGLHLVYERLSPFFVNLSGKIVDRVQKTATGKMKIKDAHIEKAFNTGDMLTEMYGRKIPGYIRKGISFLVRQIPFSELAFNIKDSIKDRDKEKASELLYNEIDDYVENSIFGNNSMKWLYWLLPLNVIIQIFIICIFLYY